MEKNWENRKISDNSEVDYTIEYYNKNAEKFITGTIDVDFEVVQNRFIDKLAKGASLLDFGCGSGRDTKYFLERGYKVTAIDGSQELCKIASEYTGITVKQMLFQELEEQNVYDGIWACSSILHLHKQELTLVLKKMCVALKKEGIIYASFKYGEFEGERNGRYFTDFTEESFLKLLGKINSLVPDSIWISNDARKERSDERWLNIILRKVEIS